MSLSSSQHYHGKSLKGGVSRPLTPMYKFPNSPTEPHTPYNSLAQTPPFGRSHTSPAKRIGTPLGEGLTRRLQDLHNGKEEVERRAIPFSPPTTRASTPLSIHDMSARLASSLMFQGNLRWQVSRSKLSFPRESDHRSFIRLSSQRAEDDNVEIPTGSGLRWVYCTKSLVREKSDMERLCLGIETLTWSTVCLEPRLAGAGLMTSLQSCEALRLSVNIITVQRTTRTTLAMRKVGPVIPVCLEYLPRTCA